MNEGIVQLVKRKEKEKVIGSGDEERHVKFERKGH